MKKLLRLYFIFFKIGIFTVGGGIAMIPLIIDQVSKKHKWIDEDEVVDAIALCQSLPGVIAVNIATHVGYKLKGALGALFATIGVITPSFIIILVIKCLGVVSEMPIVQFCMDAMRATSVSLILVAAVSLGRKSIKDKFGIIVAILSFCLVALFKVPAYFVIIIAIVLGISFKYNSRSE